VSANVRLVNNTIADNASTATNRQSFPAGPKVLSTAQIGGVAKLSGLNPSLINNIVWNNHSYVWSITPTDPTVPQTTALTDVGVWDFGVVGSLSKTALPSIGSVSTAGAGNTGTVADAAQMAFVKRIGFAPQTDSDQPGILPEVTIMTTALTFDEGGNFINVNFSPLTPWDINAGTFGEPRADYHLLASSLAVNAGVNRTAANRVPLNDFDAEQRLGACIDVGADEVGTVADKTAPVVSSISPASGARPAVGNTSYPIVLSGSNLLTASLTEAVANLSLTNIVVSDTQITANLVVNRNASLGAKVLTVSHCGGSTNVNFTVTN